LYFKLERLALRLRAHWSQGAVRQLVVDDAAPVTGWPFVEQAYRRLAASARLRNVPVTLAICPTLDTLTGQQQDDLVERLTALGRDLGWTVIDLAPALSGSARELTCLFLPNDPIHPSAAGYARLAAALAAHLPD
jgi:lysophospholipase L1-like esterase